MFIKVTIIHKASGKGPRFSKKLSFSQIRAKCQSGLWPYIFSEAEFCPCALMKELKCITLSTCGGIA